MSLLLLLGESVSQQVEVTFVDQTGTPLAAGLTATIIQQGDEFVQTAILAAGGTIEMYAGQNVLYDVTFSGANAPSGTTTFIGTGTNQTIRVLVPVQEQTQQPVEPPPPPPLPYTQAEFTQRIMALIPKRWFTDAARTDTGDPSTTGLLYAMAFGIASGFGYIASLEIPYTKNQTRWATRSDNNLDLTANDIYGTEMQRLPSEAGNDAAYSLRIRKRLGMKLQTLQAILTGAVNYYLAAEAVTANKVLQDLSLGTMGGIGTRGGLAVFQPSSEQLLVPNIYVFDTQSDPTSAAAFNITYGQVAIVIEWATDDSAFYADFAHLGRETILGHAAQVFDSTKFGPGAAPDPNLDIVVRRIKAGGVRPVYILRST